MDNQTNPEWLREINADTMWTGIFLVPDVHSEVEAELIALAVPTITYTSCVHRGAYTVGFKWVPEQVASYEEIIFSSACNGACVKTCILPSCICNRFQGRCIKPVSSQDLGSRWTGLPPTNPVDPDRLNPLMNDPWQKRR